VNPEAARCTRILLVRHGQSTWNADGRWQGQADPPLSRLGQAQASSASSSSELDGVEAWWTSDLERARDTAELLMAGRGAVVLEPRLRERHAGEWEGLTRAEIDAGWPGFLADHKRPSGWEDDALLLERAFAAITDIAVRDPGGRAVVVTHGGVVRALERRFGAEDLPVPNLGGRWVEVEDAPARLGDRVLLVDVGQVTIPGQL
jgi:probable phosphoglycerate mutase